MVQTYQDRSLIDVRAMCQAFRYRRDYVDPLLDELENLSAIEVFEFTNRRTRKTIRVNLDLVT